MSVSRSSNSYSPGWHSLLNQWGQDVRLLLMVFATLFFFRLLTWAYYSSDFSTKTPWSEFISAFVMGLRFDAATAAAWVALSFLLSLFCLFLPAGKWVNTLRAWLARFFIVVGCSLLVFDFVFVGKYGDHFNQLVFGLLEDDTQAIMQTLWKEFHPILVLSLLVLTAWTLGRVFRRGMQWQPMLAGGGIHALSGFVSRFGIGLLFFLLFFFVIRGSTIAATPLQIHNSFITSDDFLNRMIPNPLVTLRKTLQYQWQISGESGWNAYWRDGDVYSALAYVQQYRGEAVERKVDLDAYFLRQAKGAGKAPRHIFVILMESYSGWPLLPQYRSLGLADGLAELADNGVNYSPFLPSTRSTSESLNVLLTGLPATGRDIGRLPQSARTYPTSLAHIFNQLGYTTRFFYGGYIGWRRVDLLVPNQGFSELHGGGSMPTTLPANEWGVADGDLFNYVAQSISDDQPSLNFILTTTNHAPYDLDTRALGFPLAELPAAINSGDEDVLNILGHQWYSDRELGKFVKAVRERLPGSLFAITGDHAARVSVNLPESTSYVSETVPFILYGPQVLSDKQLDASAPGSHLDIIPTLVELSAPAGFSYHSFSDGLVSRKADGFAYGREMLLHDNMFAQRGDVEKWMPLQYGEEASHRLSQQQLQARAEAYNKYVSALRALSWYRSRHGAQLPEVN